MIRMIRARVKGRLCAAPPQRGRGETAPPAGHAAFARWPSWVFASLAKG